MDVFQGQFDFDKFSTQIHDFNPGITPYPSGLFWTVPIPARSVRVHPGSGRAVMHLTTFPLADHHSIPNSLAGDPVPPDPATLTYLTIEWSGRGTRSTVTDNATFSGTFVENTATVACQAAVPVQHFVFTTDSAPTTSVFAEVGHERNGVFFRQGGEDEDAHEDDHDGS